MQRLIPQIGIVMSSDKDLPRMREAAEFLVTLGIPFEMTALSPYRVPDQVREYGVGAEGSGYEVIIAGSGGTTELASMIASYTTLPGIGIPLREQDDLSGSKELAAMLSILLTPRSTPVPTLGSSDLVRHTCL